MNCSSQKTASSLFIAVSVFLREKSQLSRFGVLKLDMNVGGDFLSRYLSTLTRSRYECRRWMQKGPTSWRVCPVCVRFFSGRKEVGTLMGCAAAQRIAPAPHTSSTALCIRYGGAVRRRCASQMTSAYTSMAHGAPSPVATLVLEVRHASMHNPHHPSFLGVSLTQPILRRPPRLPPPFDARTQLPAQLLQLQSPSALPPDKRTRKARLQA